MKKYISMLLLMLVSLFVLTGCHGSKETVAFQISDEFDTNRNYEITFWAKNDTNKNQVDIYTKAVEDFEKLYPNIKVTLKLYTDYGRIYNDVITNISTNTTPNVCITYPDHIATYLTGENTVVSLDELFTDKNYGLGGKEVRFDAPTVKEIVPKFLEECKINGNYYALPFMRSTEACYINKTYVEKLGYTLPDVLTWDFVWEVSDKAAEKNSDGIYPINGQKVMIPFIYKSTDNMMIQMLRQKGAGYSDPSGEIKIFNNDAFEMLKNISGHVKQGAFSTFKISSYPANFLNAGQCIFAIDSTAGSTWMGSKAPLSDIPADQVVDFETVVMPIPQYDTENPTMISQGPSLCIFNKEDPQEVLASWLFTQFLLTNEVQVAYAETEGYVPVTLKAQESEEYTDYLSHEDPTSKEYYDIKIKASKLLIENTDNTFVTPVFNGSASLRDAAGQMIENVTKSTRRKETIDDAYMEKLRTDITSLYRLDQINVDDSVNTDLGPLPKSSKTLLWLLVVVWILMGIYVTTEQVLKKMNKKRP